MMGEQFKTSKLGVKAYFPKLNKRSCESGFTLWQSMKLNNYPLSQHLLSNLGTALKKKLAWGLLHILFGLIFLPHDIVT